MAFDQKCNKATCCIIVLQIANVTQVVERLRYSRQSTDLEIGGAEIRQRQVIALCDPIHSRIDRHSFTQHDRTWATKAVPGQHMGQFMGRNVAQIGWVSAAVGQEKGAPIRRKAAPAQGLVWRSEERTGHINIDGLGQRDAQQ